MDIKALQAEKEVIEAKIAEARKAAREGVAARVLELLMEAGMTFEDLGYAPIRAQKQRKPREHIVSVAPKYRDPESGQTWVGRGKRPTWLVNALAGGRTLESFAAQ